MSNNRVGDWILEGRYWRNVITGHLIPVIQGGALPATDNFNRAGPALGANWSGSVGDDLVIESSVQAYGDAAADHSMYWSADLPNDDQYAQASLAFLAANWGGPFV